MSILEASATASPRVSHSESLTPQDNCPLLKEKITRIALVTLLALTVISSSVAIGLLCRPLSLGMCMGGTVSLIGLTGFIVYTTNNYKTATAGQEMRKTRLKAKEGETCKTPLLQEAQKIAIIMLKTSSLCSQNGEKDITKEIKEGLRRNGYRVALINAMSEAIVKIAHTLMHDISIETESQTPPAPVKVNGFITRFVAHHIITGMRICTYFSTYLEELNTSLETRSVAIDKIEKELCQHIILSFNSYFTKEYLENYGVEKLKNEITSAVKTQVAEQVKIFQNQDIATFKPSQNIPSPRARPIPRKRLKTSEELDTLTT